MAKTSTKITLAVLGLAVALAAVEIAVRIVTSFAPPAPNLDRPLFYYKPRSANSMTDYSYEPTKAKGTFRISVVGDSFTFAPFVQFDDTYPKRLERMLGLASSSTRAEVMNLGVPGFSTKDEIALVELAAKNNSDLIILEITLNDPELKMFGPEDAKRAAFGQLRISRERTPFLYFWKTLGLVASRIHNTRANERYKDYFLSLWNDESTWDNFKVSIERILALGASSGITIVPVIFPVFGFEFNDQHPFLEIHKKIAALFDQKKLNYLDLFDTYRGMRPERLQIIPGADTHPNEIALRLAAERTYAFLAAQGLIPAELNIPDTFRERKAPRVFERFRCQGAPANLENCSKRRRNRDK